MNKYIDIDYLFQVHIVKQPFLFNMVWQMFKPFVREKLKGRMFFHGSKMSSLHNYIPPSHLPKNYDGNLPEIDYTSADWYPTLIKCDDKIKGEVSFSTASVPSSRLLNIFCLCHFNEVQFIAMFLLNSIFKYRFLITLPLFLDWNSYGFRKSD